MCMCVCNAWTLYLKFGEKFGIRAIGDCEKEIVCEWETQREGSVWKKKKCATTNARHCEEKDQMKMKKKKNM